MPCRIDRTRRAMTNSLPMRANVPVETALFRFGQTPPQRFRFGTNGIDDGTPIEAAIFCGSDVTPEAPD